MIQVCDGGQLSKMKKDYIWLLSLVWVIMKLEKTNGDAFCRAVGVPGVPG